MSAATMPADDERECGAGVLAQAEERAHGADARRGGVLVVRGGGQAGFLPEGRRGVLVGRRATCRIEQTRATWRRRDAGIPRNGQAAPAGLGRKLPGDALDVEDRAGSAVDRDLAGVAVCLHGVLLRRRLRTLMAIGYRAMASPSD